MQLRPEQLGKHLAGALAPLYVVHGDETLLVQEAVDAIRAAALAAGFGERKVFTVSGAHFDWDGLLGATQSMSLFGERQLFELRIPSGKPGRDGAQALARLAAQPSPDVLTIVQLPRLDGMQQKSAWFGALDGAGMVLRIDSIERRELPGWIARRLAAQGQRVVDGDEGERSLAFFADRVEGNLLAAHQELQKLALLHPAGALAFADIEAAVLDVARFDVFRFAQAVLGAQVARALRMLDGLRAEGEGAVLVHWALAEDVRALAAVRSALDAGRPLPMALREARVWGPKERLYERLLPMLRADALAALVIDASRVDGIVKGLKHPDWPAEPWQALRLLTLRMLDGFGAASSRHAPRLALTAEPG